MYASSSKLNSRFAYARLGKGWPACTWQWNCVNVPTHKHKFTILTLYTTLYSKLESAEPVLITLTKTFLNLQAVPAITGYQITTIIVLLRPPAVVVRQAAPPARDKTAYTHQHIYTCTHAGDQSIQSNPSNPDTVGTQSVLFSEVSSFQGL